MGRYRYRQPPLDAPRSAKGCHTARNDLLNALGPQAVMPKPTSVVGRTEPTADLPCLATQRIRFKQTANHLSSCTAALRPSAGPRYAHGVHVKPHVVLGSTDPNEVGMHWPACTPTSPSYTEDAGELTDTPAQHSEASWPARRCGSRSQWTHGYRWQFRSAGIVGSEDVKIPCPQCFFPRP